MLLRSWLVACPLVAAIASCGGGSSQESVDAGQRRYCNTPSLDAGRDGATSDRPLGGDGGGRPDQGQEDASDRDTRPIVDVGPIDARPVQLDMGGLGTLDTAGSADLVDSRVADAPWDVPTGPDANPDLGPDLIRDTSPDLAPDTRPDALPDMPPDQAPLDTQPDIGRDSQFDIVVLDSAPIGDAPNDGPVTLDALAGDDAIVGACTIGGASWAKAWMPTLGGLASAPDGTPWATGSYSHAVSYGAAGDLPAPTPDTSGNGSLDAFLLKLDPSLGVVAKAFAFGSPSANAQVALSVAVAQGGNVGVIGNYLGEIDFTANGRASDTPGTKGKDYLADSSDVAGAGMNFYVVIDSASSTGQYVTPIKARNVDLGTGTLLAAASNPSQKRLAVCGTTKMLVDIYDGTDKSNKGLLTGTPPSYGGGFDIVVAVIDASTGDVIWGSQFGGVGDQSCEAVAMDSDGNVFIAGMYNGSLDFGNGRALPTSKVAPNLHIMYVAKLDTAGTVQAASSWHANPPAAGNSASNFAEYIHTVAVDTTGNLILAGDLERHPLPDFGASIGVLESNPAGTDGFVAKLNSSLTPQWARSFGGDTASSSVVEQHHVNAVGVTSSGAVVIGGNFIGSITGLGNVLSGDVLYPLAFTAQLSGTSGTPLCAQRYGSVGLAQSIGVVNVGTVAGVDSVIVGGALDSAGSVVFGSTTLPNPSPVACDADAGTSSPSCPAGQACRSANCAATSFVAGLVP